jgi:hypothetical protein
MSTSGSKPSILPAVVGGIGALLLIAGSFMTWATVSISIDKVAQLIGVDPGQIPTAGLPTSASVAGTNGDGRYTIILGVIALVGAILVAAVATARKPGSGLLLVGGALSVLICVYEITTKDAQITDALQRFGGDLEKAGTSVDAFKQIFDVGWGVGLWACIVGGVVAAIGGVLGLLSRSVTSPAVPEVGVSASWDGSGFEAPLAPPPPSPPADPTDPGATTI